MFSYKIIKKGRKWFEAASTDKGYKAKIEINDTSKDWTEGQEVAFEGTIDKKTSGGFTHTYVFPCSLEQKKSDENSKEVEKWLGYVEKNAGEYVYTKGVTELKKLELNDEQKARLETAIVKGTISYSTSKICDYFGYIKNSISEGRWYEKGEEVIKEHVTSLEKVGYDTTTYKSKLEELKNSFVEKKEIKVKEDLERYFNIQDLSCMKGDEYRVGMIIKDRNGRLGKVVKAWKYYEEDTMSFGYMVDGGWIKCAKCDYTAVTESEKVKYEARQAKYEAEKAKEKDIAEKKTEIKKTVKTLSTYIKDNGVYPEEKQIQVPGEIVYNTFDVYGGGERIIIDGNKIWSIQNNGGDGDFWGYNNIATGGAGAIGHNMIIDNKCNELLEIIKINQKYVKENE